jgi:hypothetical protein
MAEAPLKAVFLSASIPDPSRNPRYYSTADVIAIREAIRALVGEILPRARLVFGGHPAISPLVNRAAERLGVGRDRVRIYQSKFFQSHIPAVALNFVDLRWTPEVPGDRAASLALMRDRMIAGEAGGEPAAAVFIGGMEGVEDEFRLFRGQWPDLPVLPLASTGGAARILLDQHEADVARLAPPGLATTLTSRLRTDLAYDLLFRSALRPLL